MKSVKNSEKLCFIYFVLVSANKTNSLKGLKQAKIMLNRQSVKLCKIEKIVNKKDLDVVEFT